MLLGSYTIPLSPDQWCVVGITDTHKKGWAFRTGEQGITVELSPYLKDRAARLDSVIYCVEYKKGQAYIRTKGNKNTRALAAVVGLNILICYPAGKVGVLNLIYERGIRAVKTSLPDFSHHAINIESEDAGIEVKMKFDDIELKTSNIDVEDRPSPPKGLPVLEY